MKKCLVSFEEVASLGNLYEAWEEFIAGKSRKKDVMEFARHLGDEIARLHADLVSDEYRHGPYHAFAINDPKPRNIHKASVRDRLLHHAIHRKLYPYFAARFIVDSFSCQVGKGTHRALDRFQDMARKVSRNHSRTCWVLKCDIRKYFASVDHLLLIRLLRTSIGDQRLLLLLENIISSFATIQGKGIPLGNLTSQLFSNIYLHEFDRFVKSDLRIKWYIRYADDFVLLSSERTELLALIPILKGFLAEYLQLCMHPDKVFLKSFASGVDFLGWLHFPSHRVLRTKTKERMFKRVAANPTKPTLQSYLGLLGHGDGFELRTHIINEAWLWSEK